MSPPPDLDREVLFANEAFVIGMLQAVAAASLVGALSQHEEVRAVVGRAVLGLFMGAMSSALAISVLAAWCKHEYKKFDVKRDATNANRFLGWMRKLMGTAVLIVVITYLTLAAAFIGPEACRLLLPYITGLDATNS